jgi:hypothetical protein
VSGFDVAFFSYNGHQPWLIPGLRSVIKNVPGYNKIILIWDDNVDWAPIDFQQIQDQIEHPLTVIKHSELCSWPESIVQWGWIKQQLAKLLCYQYSDQPFTWIIDGDVLITKDPELFNNHRPVLRYDHDVAVDLDASEYHSFIKKYFGISEFYPHTWVGSTCMFDNSIVEEMWRRCQQINNQTLIECVEQTVSQIVDKNKHWPFSEFELYGNYCYTHHRDRFDIQSKNWNYAPNQHGLDLPIQIMWHQFDEALTKNLLNQID